jgi:hypothetical protein
VPIARAWALLELYKTVAQLSFEKNAPTSPKLGSKRWQILGQKALALPTLGNALIFKNPFPSCENCIFNSKAFNKPQQQGGVG